MDQTTINNLTGKEWEAARQIAEEYVKKTGDISHFNIYAQAALDGIKFGLQLARDIFTEVYDK